MWGKLELSAVNYPRDSEETFSHKGGGGGTRNGVRGGLVRGRGGVGGKCPRGGGGRGGGGG